MTGWLDQKPDCNKDVPLRSWEKIMLPHYVLVRLYWEGHVSSLGVGCRPGNWETADIAQRAVTHWRLRPVGQSVQGPGALKLKKSRRSIRSLSAWDLKCCHVEEGGGLTFLLTGGTQKQNKTLCGTREKRVSNQHERNLCGRHRWRVPWWGVFELSGDEGRALL